MEIDVKVSNKVIKRYFFVHRLLFVDRSILIENNRGFASNDSLPFGARTKRKKRFE